MIVPGEPPCAAPALASLAQFLHEFHPTRAGLVVIAAFCEVALAARPLHADLLVHSLDQTAWVFTSAERSGIEYPCQGFGARSAYSLW